MPYGSSPETGAVPPTLATFGQVLPLAESDIRACLSAGLKVVKPMTYMAMREYTPPRGAWCPSVLY